MKALVLGSGGQLGVDLVRELDRRAHQVAGFTRQQLDITSAPQVEEAFRAHQPGWVINAAAYNMVDVAEREPLAAMQANGLAARHLAACCRSQGAILLQFSTDHVFDGSKSSPYTEQDLPRPVSAYGVSKLAGELYVQAYLERFFVVRTSGVFGPAGRTTNRSNFPELMLRLAAEGRPLRVVDDFFASPTYAPALAARSLDLLENKAPFGIYHIGGGRPISWYQFALLVLAQAGVRANITPAKEQDYPTPARRPKYAALSNAKMEAVGLAPMPRLEEVVGEYLVKRLDYSAAPLG